MQLYIIIQLHPYVYKWMYYYMEHNKSTSLFYFLFISFIISQLKLNLITNHVSYIINTNTCSWNTLWIFLTTSWSVSGGAGSSPATYKFFIRFLNKYTSYEVNSNITLYNILFRNRYRIYRVAIYIFLEQYICCLSSKYVIKIDWKYFIWNLSRLRKRFVDFYGWKKNILYQPKLIILN